MCKCLLAKKQTCSWAYINEQISARPIYLFRADNNTAAITSQCLSFGALLCRHAPYACSIREWQAPRTYLHIGVDFITSNGNLILAESFKYLLPSNVFVGGRVKHR